EAAARMAAGNHVKQIGLALYEFRQAHGRLPPAIVYDKDGTPLHSWRVLLLPYLEQDDLFRRFRLNEPWDSPANADLLPLIPKVYAAREATAEPYTTYYQVFDGPGAAFESDRRLGLRRLGL